jgi:four helix bundle protein
MNENTHMPMEDMEVHRAFVEVCDEIWKIVLLWVPLARDTVGKQIIRAADSVGANLVEGDGRYGDADALHFFVIARASARETRYWLERAKVRDLVTQEDADCLLERLTGATIKLNNLIRHRRDTKRADRIRDDQAEYDAKHRAQPKHRA